MVVVVAMKPTVRKERGWLRLWWWTEPWRMTVPGVCVIHYRTWERAMMGALILGRLAYPLATMRQGR